MKSSYGWYAVGSYCIILVLLFIAGFFIHCYGEWCGWIPFGWAFHFWGNVLLSISLHWYLLFQDIPGFTLIVFLLDLLTVYGIGVLFERWRQIK